MYYNTHFRFLQEVFGHRLFRYGNFCAERFYASAFLFLVRDEKRIAADVTAG